MTPKITMIQDPGEAHMRRAIAGPLGRFNETQTGQLEDYRPLAILVSHPDTAEILGGLWGETVCRQNLMDKLTKELRESLAHRG
jgi:hypothetical protein